MSFFFRVFPVVILLLSCNTWASVIGQGRVTMTGQLLASACNIHTDDVWQEVNFGTHSFNSQHNLSRPISRPVSIRLVNCHLENSETWRDVSVTFDGVRSSTSDATFAVSGPAKGIALQLTDERGYIARPGEELPTVWLSPEGNSLNYRLHVVQTDEQAKEGEWSAFLRFMVEYQ